MINVNPLGTPGGSFPWPDFENLYNDIFDSSFANAALTRSITLHLIPIKQEASGITQAGRPAVQYNPYLGRGARPAPINISTTRTPAARFTPRDVSYNAHIKHGPTESPLQDTGIELDVNQVATTTLIESESHVVEAESATIDGKRYQLHKPPRQIGWRNRSYIITVWEVISEAEAP